jgi:transcription elongation factor
LLENSGVFAIRAKSVELTGVKKNSDAPQQRQSNFKAKKFRHPDTNKLVRINKGVYKGYMGTIREANESIAHVVLQTKFKTIKVPIGEYTVVSGHENEKSRTNPWDYSRSKTPHMGDVMTPSVHDGLRTPNPDYPETPRTPNDVWNPNKPNTPFNDRPITPSSSRTPFSTFPSKSIQTPMMSSYSSVNTPGTGSYGSSTTPGTSYSSVNTPGGTYSSVNTPGGTYSSVNTPGTYSSVNTPGGTYSSINTPGGTYSSVNTPGTSYSSINTPISSYSSVNTPGTSSYSSINTPSSYSSVNTPGTSYSSVNTPGTSYSSVNTPGTSYSSINTPSYSSVNTPGTYSSINTPGGTYSSVNTPGTSSYSSISTPGTYTSSSTPGYYNPLNTQTPMSYSSYSSISTPGTYSSINTPGTYSGSYQGITPSYGPNSSITSKSEKEITLDTGIEISITQGQYSGLKGCVKQALSDQATIIISDGKEEKLVDVPISSLELTMPKKKEKVKIIQGEHKGTIGVLMGMEDDGGMGIVRSSKDGKGNILVVNLSFIAKLMDQN